MSGEKEFLTIYLEYQVQAFREGRLTKKAALEPLQVLKGKILNMARNGNARYRKIADEIGRTIQTIERMEVTVK